MGVAKLLAYTSTKSHMIMIRLTKFTLFLWPLSRISTENDVSDLDLMKSNRAFPVRKFCGIPDKHYCQKHQLGKSKLDNYIFLTFDIFSLKLFASLDSQTDHELKFCTNLMKLLCIDNSSSKLTFVLILHSFSSCWHKELCLFTWILFL